MRRPARLRPVVIALFVLACLGRPEAADAWGRLGHRVSARLAEGMLLPNARKAIDALLEPGESLADAALWPDEIRGDRPETGPWHYVNVPISEARYHARFCPAQAGCVVSAIREQEKILADRNAPVEKRREALRFVVHFIQDMHQPLHVGDHGDRGGNDTQVQYFDKGSNLHRVWDSGLIESYSDDEIVWLQELLLQTGGVSYERWSRGTLESWADESLQAAKRAYRAPGSTGPMKSGTKLGQSYLDDNLPIVRERLTRSSIRVASELNRIFR